MEKMEDGRDHRGDAAVQGLTSAGSYWHLQLRGGRKELTSPKPRYWAHLLNPNHGGHACRKLLQRRNNCSGGFTPRGREEKYPLFSLPPTL